MRILSYAERGYEESGYVSITFEMSDGTQREIMFQEDQDLVGEVKVKHLKMEDAP